MSLARSNGLRFREAHPAQRILKGGPEVCCLPVQRALCCVGDVTWPAAVSGHQMHYKQRLLVSLAVFPPRRGAHSVRVTSSGPPMAMHKCNTGLQYRKGPSPDDKMHHCGKPRNGNSAKEVIRSRCVQPHERFTAKQAGRTLATHACKAEVMWDVLCTS